MTQRVIFFKLETPHIISIFSIGTKFVLLNCSAACPLLFLAILEANLVVTEMLLSLATSHFKRAIQPSLNVILTFFCHSKTQTISLDCDLSLLRSFDY